MRNSIFHAVLMVGAVFFMTRAYAQDTYVITNSVGQITTFTNTLGTASLVDGLIVFEGQLDADMAVGTNYNATSDSMLASLQLLVQVKLFDDLPSSNEVGEVQGAIAALRDGAGLSTGKYYVWASTNNVMEWVPLYQKDTTTQFSVTEDTTNYITFVFNYSASPVTYQVFIGGAVDTQVASESVTSLTSETAGINSVSLLGTGSLKTFATASGDPGPLSASISFSVYNTADGTMLILNTVSEQGSGDLIVMAYIDGVWTEVGRVPANGSNHYEFLANQALPVGQSYAFKVIDEIGNEHLLSNPVEVKTVKMDSIVMTPDVMLVSFNTESGKRYQVMEGASPAAAEWTPAVVYYPVSASVGDGSGWAYGSEAFTATGSTITIKIPRGDASKAFFKVKKLD